MRVVAMRRLILLGLLAAMALPAGAARHVTVAQLEKMLAAADVKHREGTELVPSLAISSSRSGSRMSRGLHLRQSASGTAGNPAPATGGRSVGFSRPSGGEWPANAQADDAPHSAFWMPARSYVTKTLPPCPTSLHPHHVQLRRQPAGIQKG